MKLAKLIASLITPYAFIILRDRLRQKQWQRQQTELHKNRQARISITKSLRNKSPNQWFDYNTALILLEKLGCNQEQVREGSISEPSLRFCAEHLGHLKPSTPLLGLHVGNFVGVSLAYFVHFACQRHPDSVVISIDPNIVHRGVKNPADKVIMLLNHFRLQKNALILTGYSLEKSISNDGFIFDSYDPVQFHDTEISCEDQLFSLSTFLPNAIDFCVIDGNHEKDYLSRELDIAHKLLKPGGYLILDDISWAWPELQQLYQTLDTTRYTKLATDGRIGILVRRD